VVIAGNYRQGVQHFLDNSSQIYSGYVFALIGHLFEPGHNVIQLFFVNYVTGFFNIIPDSMTAGMLAKDEVPV
jgi:hypothetical protein